MADFKQGKQTKLQALAAKFKKKTKHRMASVDHKKASRFLEHGRKCYNEKKYKKAERYFQQALDADGLYPLAHYMMGIIFLRRDDTRSALRYFEQAIKIDPASDVARKADKKIELINAKVQNVIQALEDRQKF